MTGARVLVVEDESSQLELLSYNLGVDGYEVFRADNGEEGLMILQEQEIDLVLLDWMLPGTSGLEVCRQIKAAEATAKIPVILLTARGEEDDKIRGLDTGADDYVVKPYSVKELMARVRARLRKKGVAADVLRQGDVVMDIAQHRVSVGDQEVTLGPLEFKMLRVFLDAPGRVLSRDQLLDRVWSGGLDVDTRTVDVHVGRLRKQLAGASGQEFIRTVRGFGYAFET